MPPIDDTADATCSRSLAQPGLQVGESYGVDVVLDTGGNEKLLLI